MRKLLDLLRQFWRKGMRTSSSVESPSLHFLWALGAALLSFALLYRLRLAYNLFYSTPSFRGFLPSKRSFLELLPSFWQELAWIVVLLAMGWVLLFAMRRWKDSSLGKALVITGMVGLHGFFIGQSFLYGVHLRVLFEMQSGLTYDLWMEGASAFGIQNILPFMTLSDMTFILSPVAFFWLFWLSPPLWSKWQRRVVLVLLLLLPLTAFSFSSATPLDKAIRLTPAQFLLTDFIQSLSRRAIPKGEDLDNMVAKPANKVRTRKPSKPSGKGDAVVGGRAKASPPLWEGRKQSETMRLFHPLFAKETSVTRVRPKGYTAAKAKVKATKKPWNLLLIVMESVGTRYIFDRSSGNRTPMAFLEKVSKRGWFFRKHFSTANSSPRSFFSMFTGLYPVPRMKMYVMRRDVCTPSLATFLHRRYDTFLMTPSPLSWYFPKWFFRNNCLTNLYGARKFRRFKRYGSFPNEFDVVTQFMKRVKKAKKPFFATYISFVPHGPYDDYGPKYRILPNIRKSRHRYYNNLYVLDLQIKRIFKMLYKTGLIENTIVALVGDHGQAFGQHRRNWGHSRKSFNENYHSPLIFFQPKLFKPKEFNHYTSHVDVFPTLLELLGVPYNPLLIQGESLLNDTSKRKQIFFYGNENTLSSITKKHIKIQYSYKRRRCWVYDLANDPFEMNRLSCRDYGEDKKALLSFYRVQAKLMRKYQRTCRKGKGFFGLTHRETLEELRSRTGCRRRNRP